MTTVLKDSTWLGYRAHEICQTSRKISKLSKSIDTLNTLNPRDFDEPSDNMKQIVHSLIDELLILVKKNEDRTNDLKTIINRFK